MWVRRTIHGWRECKLAQIVWKSVWRSPKTTWNWTTIWASYASPQYPERHLQSVFIAAWFIPGYRNKLCPTAEEWIKKMCYFFAQWIFAGKWLWLEIIASSWVSLGKTKATFSPGFESYMSRYIKSCAVDDGKGGDSQKMRRAKWRGSMCVSGQGAFTV